ncbi:hypothetical protein ACQUY5_24525 [Bacillus cereus]|uniref:hypothetical protein n=1 Tax=Bacillus cereus TaxID=1396 RepID=UPI003D1815A3
MSKIHVMKSFTDLLNTLDGDSILSKDQFVDTILSCRGVDYNVTAMTNGNTVQGTVEGIHIIEPSNFLVISTETSEVLKRKDVEGDFEFLKKETVRKREENILLELNKVKHVIVDHSGTCISFSIIQEDCIVPLLFYK